MQRSSGCWTQGGKVDQRVAGADSQHGVYGESTGLGAEDSGFSSSISAPSSIKSTLAAALVAVR
jgi:hypothetical protein